MKQNEMSLILQDLWGEAKSISDMISRPEIIVENYLQDHADNNILNSYDNFIDMDPEERKLYKQDWEHSTWYVGADKGIQDFIRSDPDLLKATQ